MRLRFMLGCAATMTIMGAANLCLSQTTKPRAAAPATAPVSSYENMDDARLAETLQTMNMTELLRGLADRNAQSGKPEKMLMAANLLLTIASRTANQDVADATVDQAIAIQDTLLAAEQKGSTDKDKIEYLRTLLLRATTEGITKIAPYSQRMQYLLDSPSDRQKIVKSEPNAMPVIDRLLKEIEVTRDAWRDDANHKISGNYYQLDDIQTEAAFRKGWMLTFLGEAMNKADGNKRSDVLEQAIVVMSPYMENLAESGNFQWAIATAVSQRELGKFQLARETLKKVLDGSAPPDQKARALFELAHVDIDEDNGQKVDAAVQQFREKAPEDGLQPLAISMQSTLLTSHGYELQAEAVKASDPKKAAELSDKSFKVILDFMLANPKSTPAFLETIGPKFRGRPIQGLPTSLVMALAAWNLSDASKETQAEAERLLKDVMTTRTDPSDKKSRIQAATALGKLYEQLGRPEDAAACYAIAGTSGATTQTTTDVANPGIDATAKSAAIRSVRLLQMALNDPKAKPTAALRSQYQKALEELVKNFGKDKDVEPYYYFLGVEYERINHLPEAIKVYEKTTESCETYLPAQSRLLSLKFAEIMDSDPKDPMRDVNISKLMNQITAFHNAVNHYSGADPSRKQAAREMGADADMLAANIRLNVMNQPAEARRLAAQALKDWPDVPSIADSSLILQINAALKEGDLDAAIKLIDQVKTNVDTIVARIVAEIRQTIERLDPATDADKIAGYVKAYSSLADSVYKSAKARLEAQAKAENKAPDWVADKMYPYTQALASSYSYSDDPLKLAEAINKYKILKGIRPSDPLNIWGLARCSRKLKNNLEAMTYYEQLVGGLPSLSPDWWKADLERLQFAVDIHVASKQKNELEKIIIELKMLKEQDPAMGGPKLEPKFRAAWNRAETALNGLAAAPASAPAK